MKLIRLLRLIVLVVSSLLMHAPARAALWNDGGTYLIDDWAHQREPGSVRNANCGTSVLLSSEYCFEPGVSTQVELANHGAVGSLGVADTSSLSMSGGIVGGNLNSHDAAMVTVSGGTIGANLVARDSSVIAMSNGTVSEYFEALDFSTVTMAGGTVGDPQFGGHLDGSGYSTVTMSGGDTRMLNGSDFANVSMTGGTVSAVRAEDDSAVVISGGLVQSYMEAYDQATLTIVGSDFAVDDVSVALGPIIETSGQLTGTLLSGEPIDVSVYRNAGATILLASESPTPPPPAVPVILNDGAMHVIDDDINQRDPISIRNAGCDTAYSSKMIPCLAPGEPTELDIQESGSVGGLAVGDSSLLTFSGGVVTDILESSGRSTTTVSSGSLEGGILASDHSMVTIAGGDVGGALSIRDSSTVTLVGSGFIVETFPIGHGTYYYGSGGTVSQTLGQLSGTLASGEPIEITFLRDESAKLIIAGTSPASPPLELTLFNDGGSSTIETAVDFPGSYAMVRDLGCGTALVPSIPWSCHSAGTPTQLEISSGGEISGTLEVTDSSDITLSGGTVNGIITARGQSAVSLNTGSLKFLHAFDSSHISIGGGILEEDIVASELSSITMSGGVVAGTFEAEDFSTVTINGGEIKEFYAVDFSTVSMSGGAVEWELSAGDDASVEIRGGTIEGDLYARGFASITVSGGAVGGNLYVSEDASIAIVGGSGFALDGVPVDFGPIAEESGKLTGLLASGEPINNNFVRWDNGSITLLVPEPSGALLQGVAFLCLGVIARYRSN